MRIRPSELERIRDGSLDLAFRRWDRPRVLAGTKLRTAVGLVEVTSVQAVDDLTEAEARRAGAESREAVLALMAPKAPAQIYRVGLRYAGADPRIALRAAAELDADDIAALRTKLDRLDAASPRGPWTRSVLALIEANAELRAPDLAASIGRDTVTFKRDVRKLKELGLTESLPVGYRIAPRGAALLRALGQ